MPDGGKCFIQNTLGSLNFKQIYLISAVDAQALSTR